MRKLKLEFMSIDIDGNNKVDKKEMNAFLAQKGIAEEHRKEIVDELFSKCDQDNNGDIDIDEFVAEYIKTKDQLEAQKDLNSADILRLHQEIVNLKKQLLQTQQARSSAMGNGLITSQKQVTVMIVRAEGLEQGGSFYVHAQ